MAQLLKDGSARRLFAFLAVLLIISLSHHLQLGADALTAVTTLALGYIGQGTVKEILHAKEEAVSTEEEVEEPAPAKIGF